jgi:lipopolysaccharide transport system permease protein
MRRYLDIVLFNAYAELRAERERTYLGFLWWIFEPLLFMVVLWLAFDVILGRGGDGFVTFLLVGLVVWQWMKSCVTHGANSILGAHYLIQQVKLPPVVFPFVTIVSDTVKFSAVLILLIAVLLVTGEGRSPTLIALPVVLLAEFALLCAMTIWVAAFVPFVPDLRIATETLLSALMFLSGIFFRPSELSEPMRSWFFYNPVAFVIDQARQVMIYGQWPDWTGLLWVTGISLLALGLGIIVTERLHRFYPKLPA